MEFQFSFFRASVASEGPDPTGRGSDLSQSSEALRIGPSRRRGHVQFWGPGPGGGRRGSGLGWPGSPAGASGNYSFLRL